MTAAPGGTDQTHHRGRLIGGQLVGWAISIACIAFVATKVDFVSLGRAIAGLEWGPLALGLVSLAFGYAMRIVRWAMMLRAAGSPVATGACVAPFLGSIALNNVLPLRAGDVVRALVFPAQLGIGRTTAMASLLLERIMDLLAVILCLGLGLAFLGTAVQLPTHLRSIVSTLAIGSAVVLGALVFLSPRIAAALHDLTVRSAAVARVVGIVARLVERIAAMSRPRVLIALGATSIVVWIFEAGLYYSLMLALHIPTSPAAGLAVAATTTLSTLVPSTPGYVGPFHLAAFAAVSMLGSNAAQAGAFAVLAHFTLWATTTIAGALAILARRDLFSKRASEDLDHLTAAPLELERRADQTSEPIKT